MMRDSSIERSLDIYIRRRIREIPGEAAQAFPNTKAWGCGSNLDFLYGYYVGRLEEGALHYLLKATRASTSNLMDPFEIRTRIQVHRKELQEAVAKAVSP